MILWDGNDNIISVITNDDGFTTKCADLEKLDQDLAEIDRQFHEYRKSRSSILVAA